MRTAVILLAAGGSSRMRGADKLLEDAGGAALLTRSARTALASDAVETLVVLGANRSARKAALTGLPVRTVINEGWRDGMGTTLAAGVASLADDVDAAIVMLADMPDIAPDLLNRLIARAVPGMILRPVTEKGQPGNPVLFTSSHFPALATLAGDSGARQVIAENRACLATIPADGSVLTDLDTPEAWAAWRKENPS